jgi:hypothetical protein
LKSTIFVQTLRFPLGRLSLRVGYRRDDDDDDDGGDDDDDGGDDELRPPLMPDSGSESDGRSSELLLGSVSDGRSELLLLGSSLDSLLLGSLLDTLTELLLLDSSMTLDDSTLGELDDTDDDSSLDDEPSLGTFFWECEEKSN